MKKIKHLRMLVLLAGIGVFTSTVSAMKKNMLDNTSDVKPKQIQQSRNENINNEDVKNLKFQDSNRNADISFGVLNNNDVNSVIDKKSITFVKKDAKNNKLKSDENKTIVKRKNNIKNLNLNKPNILMNTVVTGMDGLKNLEQFIDEKDFKDY